MANLNSVNSKPKIQTQKIQTPQMQKFKTFWLVQPKAVDLSKLAERANGYKMRNGKVVEVVFR